MDNPIPSLEQRIHATEESLRELRTGPRDALIDEEIFRLEQKLGVLRLAKEDEDVAQYRKDHPES